MLNFFKNVFSKLLNKKIEPIDFAYTIPDKNELFQPEINEINLSLYDKSKPTILIMDDFTGMVLLLKDELGRVQCCDVNKNFNILIVTGKYAAFSVEKTLRNNPIKIDIAFLDITLGGVINNIEYDGIDTAILINSLNPECNIKFITGHTLNKHNPTIFKFMKKFEDSFNLKMDETVENLFNGEKSLHYKYIINKNSVRVKELGVTIENFLKKNSYVIK